MNVAILLLKSSACASSKKLHKNAFFMSLQDVRDHGGSCLSPCEASPASEVVFRDSLDFNSRYEILEPLQMIHRILVR